jgi:hypothetical protein
LPDHDVDTLSPTSSPVPAGAAGADPNAHRASAASQRATEEATEGSRLASAVRHAIAVDVATAAAAAADGGHGATDHVDRLLAAVPVIEQSKGLLMGYYGVDADTAYAILRRWSSVSNVKLNQLCERLTTAAARPGQEPFAGLRTFLDQLPCVGAGDGRSTKPGPRDGI